MTMSVRGTRYGSLIPLLTGWTLRWRGLAASLPSTGCRGYVLSS